MPLELFDRSWSSSIDPIVCGFICCLCLLLLTTIMDDSYVEMGPRESAMPRTTTDDDDTSSYLLLFTPTRGLRRQAVAFWHMAVPYFAEQPYARRLAVIMILLTVLNSAVRVVFSYLARDFWTALAAGDADDFYATMRRFAVALAALAPVSVLYRYTRQGLAIHWRGWMTARVLELYASHGRVYYGLERSGGGSPSQDGTTTKQPTHQTPVGVDNPDQRIAEDVRAFTEFSLSLFLTVLTAAMDLCCFSVVLATILPRLFVAILVFAGVGTAATVLIGRVLIQLNYDKLTAEANLRFSLVRIREYAEQIAFLGGEDVERRHVQGRLAAVIRNMHAMNAATRNLDFFTTYYAYLTWILPILVIAPSYFAGDVELGVIQQAAASFGHVLDDLSILITQWDALSEFSAGIDRLYTFLRAMQALDPRRTSPKDNDDATTTTTRSLMDLPAYHPLSQTDKSSWSPSSVSTPMIDLQRQVVVHDMNQSSPALMIRNLTLTTPVSSQQERVLFQNLNVQVEWGKHLLIQGTAGIGKSSLLRAMAGLWKTGSGTIQRPSDEDVYFLPQKPYCCVGTLRDQLLYPRISGYVVADNQQGEEEEDNHAANQLWHDRNKYNDDLLMDILRNVDLADLPQRAASSVSHCTNGLDAVLDWSNILSLGEQQRLAFGRLLVNQPKVVILDESTSAMDVESETRMYNILKTLPGRRHPASSPGGGVTYVSVGHRPTLLAHHDAKLVLRRDGPCEVEPIR